jgi:hypothetical protein
VKDFCVILAALLAGAAGLKLYFDARAQRWANFYNVEALLDRERLRSEEEQREQAAPINTVDPVGEDRTRKTPTKAEGSPLAQSTTISLADYLATHNRNKGDFDGPFSEN